MKRIFLLAVLSALTGCSTYRERFTYYGPNGTNHVVDVSHKTFLMFGQAATLKTETQTMEFIRTVNATGVLTKPDAESVKAVTKGATEAVIEGLKKSAGVPK